MAPTISVEIDPSVEIATKATYDSILPGWIRLAGDTLESRRAAQQLAYLTGGKLAERLLDEKEDEERIKEKITNAVSMAVTSILKSLNRLVEAWNSWKEDKKKLQIMTLKAEDAFASSNVMDQGVSRDAKIAFKIADTLKKNEKDLYFEAEFDLEVEVWIDVDVNYSFFTQVSTPTLLGATSVSQVSLNSSPATSQPGSDLPDADRNFTLKYSSEISLEFSVMVEVGVDVKTPSNMFVEGAEKIYDKSKSPAGERDARSTGRRDTGLITLVFARRGV
jgi:hypothetical protein